MCMPDFYTPEMAIFLIHNNLRILSHEIYLNKLKQKMFILSNVSYNSKLKRIIVQIQNSDIILVALYLEEHLQIQTLNSLNSMLNFSILNQNSIMILYLFAYAEQISCEDTFD